MMDKMKNIDILILIYDKSNKLSFESLKRFYYIYYKKFEEKDKPKNIIVIKFNSISKDINNNDNDALLITNDSQQIKNLFGNQFYSCEDNEEKLDEILKHCINNLNNLYNYTEDYRLFKYIKLDEEINIVILIYGEKNLQKLFLKLLLELKCNFKHKDINDNICEIKYEKILNNKKLNFKLKLILIEKEYYDCDSNCKIFLYDTNNIKTYETIKKIIREKIMDDDSNLKKTYNLFSLNSSTNLICADERIDEIINGKRLSNEIGAYFSVINLNNNNNLNEEMKNYFDKILEQIIDCVNNTQTTNQNINKNEKKDNNKDDFDFYDIQKQDSPLLYINELNNKINNIFKKNESFLNNICLKCYNYFDIRINYASNTFILYCGKCKTGPRALSSEQLINYHLKVNEHIYCEICKKIFNYDFKKKNLFCLCENSENKKIVKTPNKSFIPCIIKNNVCDIHKKFHKYYMKYSKKGLCEECYKKVNKDIYFIEKFDDNEINKLIKQKKNELKEELDFINSLQNKFNECINSLLVQFEKLIGNKIKMNYLKSELVNTLEIIKNNYTILSNINSLKFDTGKNFNYNKEDSIENKLKYIFNYLKPDIDINKLYSNNTTNFFGPYNHIINKKEAEITDICGINKNKLVCISYNDGQAKIYDLNREEKIIYPKCVIKEFLENEGVNSIYVSNKDNILKSNNYNKNEIIFLNGYEKIKFIQMNENYDSYNVLYTVNDEYNNIYTSIGIDYNNILTLDTFNNLKLIFLNTAEDKETKNESKDVTDILIPFGKSAMSLKKISDKIISLTLSNYKDNNNFIVSKDDDANDLIFEKKFTISNRYTINDLYSKDYYIKILYLYGDNYQQSEDNISSKDNCNDLKIKKEFTFDKNFNLLGCISEKDNLLLIYVEDNKNEENLFYIFDFNICQFVNVFKFQNLLISPILFAKMNCENMFDKNAFILCDNNLNYLQLLYEQNYENQIYNINSSKSNVKPEQQVERIIILDKKIFLFCNNGKYYIINTISK